MNKNILPIEIVWEIGLFCDIKTLPNIFLVSKYWSKIHKEEEFWRVYFRNQIRVPNPQFPESSLEKRLKNIIDEDKIEELKKIDIEMLKTTKTFAIKNQTWIHKEYLKIDFLDYAVMVGSCEVVRYFITNKVFDEQEIKKQIDLNPKSENILFLKKTHLLYLATVYSRRNIISLLIEDLKILEESPFPFKLQLYTIGFKNPFLKELLKRKLVVTSVIYLIPILLRDFETFKTLITLLPKEFLRILCHLPSKRNFIYISSLLKRYEFVEYALENGAFFYEYSKKHEKGYWKCLEGKIPQKIIDKIIIANEKMTKEHEEDGYPLFVSTITSKTVRLTGCRDDMTIKDLKEKVEDKEGIPIKQQRMIYWAKGVPDFWVLKDWNIGCYSIIHLVLALRG